MYLVGVPSKYTNKVVFSVLRQFFITIQGNRHEKKPLVIIIYFLRKVNLDGSRNIAYDQIGNH